MRLVGFVAELRRYPVKSLGGELLSWACVDERGMEGDRLWAVTDADGKLGSTKSTRRFRRMDGLLELGAVYEESVPVITFPDRRRIEGRDPAVDVALSGHVGRPVRLRAEGDVPHFDEGPIHLVTTASLDAVAKKCCAPVSAARLRANLLVQVAGREEFLEDDWVGRTLAVGPTVTLRIRGRMPRCVMVDLPQAGLPSAPGLLQALGKVNGAALGVFADVVSPGKVDVKDSVHLVE